MGNCVLSNQNRFYVKVEPAFGQAPAIAAADRIAAVKLGIRQRDELRDRKDKTGSRTFVGVAPGGRKRTQFDLQTYLLAGTTPGTAPAADVRPDSAELDDEGHAHDDEHGIAGGALFQDTLKAGDRL